jgi:hypothetical protein
MENPFADYGTEVTGTRFVGREAEVSQVRSRVFGAAGFGSIAIVGLPRVGKTSLGAEALRRARAAAPDARRVIYRIDVGVCSTAEQLFRKMIDEARDLVRQRGWWTSEMERASQCLSSAVPIQFDDLKRLLRCFREASVQVVCVLDEFDVCRRLFINQPGYFHWIREMCSNAEFKLALILITKRRLRDVAGIAGFESDYWGNVIATLTLRPFREEEVDALLSPLRTGGVAASQAVDRERAALCGGQPFLLDMYAFHAWQRHHAGGRVDVMWFREAMQRGVRAYYEQVTTVLSDCNLLGKTVQALVGPQWDLRTGDIDELVAYGVLGADDSGGVRSFSSGFADYLRGVECEGEAFALWRDTERAVRAALEHLLVERFGVGWDSALVSAHPRLQALVQSCRERMLREREVFGLGSSESLLSYSYPMDLFSIMAADWNSLGAPVFGPHKQGWSEKFALLSKVRTPMAHNRSEVLKEALRLQAQGVCREALELTLHWENAGRPAVG